MITNSSLTIYHKGFDSNTKLEKWTRYNYDKVWFFDTQGAKTDKGYSEANNVQIRIPYNQNNVDIKDFAKGDIIVKGALKVDIETQQDLSNYKIYNIISINDNDFGNNPHIHLRGE